MMQKKISLFLLLLALSLQPNLQELNSGPLQEKAGQEELKHEVVVVLKLVQVYVTDKKGNPITDLEKSDFILYDNGKLQTVTDFERHIFKQEIELRDTKPELTRKASPLLNRKFFFLLDYGRNAIYGIKESKNAALHFIDTRLQPSDEVGVLSYSRLKGLILHEYLTTDHQKVRETIKKMRDVPKDIEGKTMSAGEDAAAEGYFESGALIEASGADAEERRFEEANARESIKVIREFAKSLRYIPGHKNIIFFSHGFTNSPMDLIFRDLFEDMCKEFASSNTPVYTVYTRRIGRNDYLRMLSDLSGGKHLPNVGYHEKIAEQIQNVTGNYYVLGYYIDEQWNGKYHKIKVEVNRKGCQVYAQQGFFNPKPFTEFSEVEKRLHLFDLALSDNPKLQTPYILPSVALPCSDKEESNLVMFTEIHMDKIKEVIKGKCEVLAFIFDELNNIADSHEGEINFYTLSQKKIYLYSISSLLPGNYECRFVLRDIKTGKGAVASSSVVIPEASDSRIKLFPPLLLIPGENALYLKLSHDQEKGKEKEPLSFNDVYPLLPKDFSPLMEEANRGIKKLLAVLRLSIVDDQESKIEIYANLIDYSTNKKIPLSESSIVAAEKREGTNVLLIEFQLPELEVGEYSVEIIAEEMTTQEKFQTTRTFKIRER